MARASRSPAGLPNVRIVRDGDLLAVTARDRWHAIEGARMLATEWSGGGLPDEQTTYDELRNAASMHTVTRDDGAYDAAFTNTVVREAAYRWPFQASIRCARGSRSSSTFARTRDPKGPAMFSTLRGSLRAGRIAGWEHHVWTPAHFLVRGAPPGSAVAGDRNAAVDYATAAQRVVVHVVPQAVLRQSALRSLGAAHNVFANESFFDELAFAAGADPLRFRLAHVDEPRARAVLEGVAALAEWTGGEPHADGPLLCGRGVAYARYDGHGAYVAAVATCTVDPRRGQIAVRDVALAHDCGQIVNPDGLRSQIEGNATQATSRALLEQVRFDRRCVISSDWSRYPILRFSGAPTVRSSRRWAPASRRRSSSRPPSQMPCSRRSACACVRFRSAPSVISPQRRARLPSMRVRREIPHERVERTHLAVVRFGYRHVDLLVETDENVEEVE